MSPDPFELARTYEDEAARSPDPKEAAALRLVADEYWYRAAAITSGGSALVMSRSWAST